MSTYFPSTDFVTYDVNADSLEGVADAIADMPEAGSCEWRPVWSVNFDDAGVVTEATVEIAMRITLPRWVEESSATDQERSEWQRFLDALAAHENGHLALAHQYLADVDQTMTGGSQDDAARTFDDAIAALQSASDDYDSATDHGRYEGTVINL